MTNEMLDAALMYASMGIPVFRLMPRSKEPFKGSHGLLDATTDEQQIRAWWGECPDANIGGRTGSGLVVIDVDVDPDKGEDGYAWLREWELAHSELPETATAITGRGGMHVWLKVGGNIQNSANPEIGVDIRGDGGFVVMPPSIHPNGSRYGWENHPEDVPIADADKDAIALIEAVRPKRRGRPTVKAPKGGVGEGGRNDYLFRLGCSLRADEGNDDDVIAAVLEAHNMADCKPPLPKGELNKLIWSVLSLPRGYSDEVKKAKAEAKGKPKGRPKFDHAGIAERLMSENGACFVDGMPAIRHGNVYEIGWNAVSREIIAIDKDATRNNQKEVQHYLSVMAERKRQSDPRLVAFQNGVLDVTTMELLEWSDEHVIPNIIPHDWDPGAECPEVDATLMKMANGEVDVLQSLIEVMGVCMYRSSEFTQSAILLGDGSNGKSTYIRMLQALLGRENISSLDLSMVGRQFYTNQLAGKLANLGDDISNEFKSGEVLSIFKKVVDGNRIYADVKGVEGFEFEPYCTLVFSANEFPRLGDYSEGVMRRLFPIEFNAVFRKTDADYDPRIGRKVTSERACKRMAVLGIQGLRQVIERNGFTPNAASERKVEDIRADNDSVLAWAIDTQRGADELDGTVAQALYDEYRSWCADTGANAVKRTKFTRSVNKNFGMEVVPEWRGTASKRCFRKV